MYTVQFIRALELIHTNTYESKSLRLKSRIDFFLVSKQFINDVIKTETRTSIAPDHKAIFPQFENRKQLNAGTGNMEI